MEQKERRGKLQNAHRMSRKGYAGLEAELVSSCNFSTFTPNISTYRALTKYFILLVEKNYA